MCETGENPTSCPADCMGSPSGAFPVLPVTLGSCLLDEAPACPGTSRLIHIPFEGCFTSLSDAVASDANIVNVLPATCCSPTPCGGGQTPALSVGDAIATENGNSASILSVLLDCVNDHTIEFIAPVTACTPCNQAQQVVGFVRVVIDHIVNTGPASSKGVYLRVLCPTCGDGACSAPEDCRSCNADCGPCTPVCE